MNSQWTTYLIPLGSKSLYKLTMVSLGYSKSVVNMFFGIDSHLYNHSFTIIPWLNYG